MAESDVTRPDGSVDWSQGVNSIKTPTVQSSRNPNGLSRNELAWLNNGTVRDGGITQRDGWKLKGRMRDGKALFQGKFMYQPRSGDPYNVVAIGGHIYRVNMETGALTDLSLTAFRQNPTPPIGIYLKNQNIPAGTSLVIASDSEAATVYHLSGSVGPAPAIGSTIFVQVNSPYTGTVPATINIAQEFQVVSYANCGGFSLPGGEGAGMDVTLKNVTAPLGTNITVQPGEGWGNKSGWSNPSFVAPAVGATVVVHLSSPLGAACFLPKQPPGTLLHFNQFQYQLVNTVLPQTKSEVGIHPEDIDFFYFCQGEEFLVIQAGDFKTLPLIWDGSILRKSKGITDTAVAAGAPGVNEIPAAGPMDYYMGRLWYAIGRTYAAGDIVKGRSGTGQYDYRDAILNVTESPLIAGGDGFTVPDNSGNITALTHNANIDTSIGQGRLFISTSTAIYSLQVPVTRTDWIGMTQNNLPLQTVVQLANGGVGYRSFVTVNGDLYFQSQEPQIRSLIQAMRLFGQPGNLPFAANENRVLKFVDRSLLRFASGIYFNNRLLETSLPRQLTQGVVHDALIPLDFMPISSFEQQKSPNWEGVYQGLQILQLSVGTFNGRDRAFAIALSSSQTDPSFNLWELTTDDKFDNVDNRVEWFMEFPALNWGSEFEMKKLVAFELWIDRLFGEVAFKVEWRVDGDPCWQLWHQWKQCSARNSCEDANNPVCYPLVPFQESYRATMMGPRPPAKCDSITGRPAYIGYQFQVKLTIKGFCRVRGFLLHAEKFDRKLYDKITC